MAETSVPGNEGQGAGARREVKLRIDEQDLHTGYANTIRTSTTPDEVVLDFGINLPVAGKQDELIFKVGQQVILNWRSAKRLGLSLANLIRQHEERFGEIELNPRPRKSQG